MKSTFYESQQGASLEPKDSIDAGWVERSSPRRAGDGEEVSGEVDDGDSLDKRLPVMKVWT
jgi:hypothetical protein